MKRRYCQKFSPGPARRRPCTPWMTDEATRRASSTSRGIDSASVRAPAVACLTEPVSMSAAFGSAICLSDARFEAPDHVGDGLAFRPRRKGQRHTMFEYGLGEFQHVVDRWRKASIEQRAGAHGEHQGLTGARAGAPGDQLGEIAGLGARTRRAH